MIEYWVWLSTRSNVGARTSVALLEAFGNPEEVYRANREQLLASGCITPNMLPSLLDKSLLETNRILADCTDKQIRILTLHEDGYPASLRVIADPPLILYLRGDLPDTEERPVIGIVGARSASAYGLSVAERMGYQLHAGGCTVVSGMAKGVDGAAMRGALKAGNRVIAVLGCGVDTIYPRENKDIYNELLTRGCIVSEYPPQTPPVPENFPPRNRIISGLSDGVLIVEAPKKSGSLITAEDALEQNRDVFAIPGNIGVPACEGSNRLIRNGAELVQDGSDILQAYAYRYELTPDQAPSDSQTEKTIDTDKPIVYIDAQVIPQGLSAECAAVMKAVGASTLTMDEVISASGLRAGKVLSAVTLLEVKGYLQRLAGNRFRRLK